MKRVFLALFLICCLPAVWATPIPVFYSGYYSNLDYGFASSWSVDFSAEVVVPVYVFEPGPLEILSTTLDPNSEVWITLDSANGTAVQHDARITALNSGTLSKAYYISQDILDQMPSNRVYVHIESQPWGNSRFGDWFLVRKHYEQQQTEDIYLTGMETAERRMLTEGSRLSLMRQIGDIGQQVWQRQMATRMMAMGATAVSSGLSFANGQASMVSTDLQFAVDVMNEANKTMVVGSPSTSGEQLLVGLGDAGWAALSAAHGNYLPAIVTFSEAMLDLSFLSIGIWQSHQLDEDIDAMLLSELLVRDALRELSLPSWSDAEIVSRAEALVPELDQSSDCSVFSNVFYSCYHGDFREETLLDQFGRAMQYFAMARDNWRDSTDAFSDVDLDGVSNTEEVEEGSDPNDPGSLPVYVTNRCPAAAISVSNSSAVGQEVQASSASSDPDGNIESLSWSLFSPEGSSASLNKSEGSNVAFTPDKEGTYNLSLTASDPYCSGTVSRSVQASVQYDDSELVEVVEDEIYVEHSGSIGTCQLIQKGYEEVPSNERWTEVTMAGSGQDIVLLMNKNSPPSVDDGAPLGCEDGYTQVFETDFEIDFWGGTQIEDWNEDFNPGDRLYVAIYSYEGESSVSGMVGDIRRDLDWDNDGTPDAEEDPACRNDPSVQFDSDGDGFCNNADAFPNDPAASVDSDGDGYPDAWLPGESGSTSTTGLVLDEFPGNGAEWTDRDGDGFGDNQDAFPDHPEAHLDSDGDGYPDSLMTALSKSSSLVLDDFPQDPAAHKDSDLDGAPDFWNPGYGGESSTTGLTLDEFPSDPDEQVDSDGDGVGDNSDQFPADPLEWVDSDGDSVGDNGDVAPQDPTRSDNEAPSISLFSGWTMAAGNALSLVPELVDADGDEMMIDVLGGDASGFATIEDGRVMVSPPIGTATGEYNLKVRVTDSFGESDLANVSFSVALDALFNSSFDQQ
jgi:hypothetical protein